MCSANISPIAKNKNSQTEKGSNRLVVNKILIDNFENITHFETAFDARLVVLPCGIEAAVLKAIGIILKCKPLAGDKVYAPKKTVIKAEISVNGQSFSITATNSKDCEFNTVVTDQNGNICANFYDIIGQTSEEANLSYFVFDPDNRFSERYKYYKDIEKYFAKDNFSKLTNGIGETNLFRLCLSSHIKDYNKSNTNTVNILRPFIIESGEVVLKSKSSYFDRKYLSESDTVLFEYLCYLDINKFWERIEDVRDFHHIFWPLFITDLCKRTDSTAPLKELIGKALSLNRQVFICDGSN